MPRCKIPAVLSIVFGLAVLGLVASHANSAVAAPEVGASILASIGGRLESAAADTDLPVLYEQRQAGVNGQDYVDQDFEAGFLNYDTFIADNFAVPDGQQWTVEEIFFAGQSVADGGKLAEADALHCIIFADAQGLPDGVPIFGPNPGGLWNESFTPSEPGVTIIDNFSAQVALSSPPVLASGTYWIACFPSMTFGKCNDHNGHWSARLADVHKERPAQIVNPGGGFALPETWSDLESADGGRCESKKRSIAFTLYGEKSGGDDDTCDDDDDNDDNDNDDNDDDNDNDDNDDDNDNDDDDNDDDNDDDDNDDNDDNDNDDSADDDDDDDSTPSSSIDDDAGSSDDDSTPSASIDDDAGSSDDDSTPSASVDDDAGPGHSVHPYVTAARGGCGG